MIYLDKPHDFNPVFSVVSCFVITNWEVLFLLRNLDKPEWWTWWVPAWKVDKFETLNSAISRELYEETWLVYDFNEGNYFKKIYVRYPNYNFIYHIYYLNIIDKPIININFNEHSDYRWISPDIALNMNLIKDEDSCIKLFFNIN